MIHYLNFLNLLRLGLLAFSLFVNVSYTLEKNVKEKKSFVVVGFSVLCQVHIGKLNCSSHILMVLSAYSISHWERVAKVCNCDCEFIYFLVLSTLCILKPCYFLHTNFVYSLLHINDVNLLIWCFYETSPFISSNTLCLRSTLPDVI